MAEDGTLKSLGLIVKAFRESKGLTQDQLAQSVTPKASRSTIALLEQGRRLPEARTLEAVCKALGIPESSWEPLLDERSGRLVEFETALGELVGRTVSLSSLDPQAAAAAESQIEALTRNDLTRDQAFDALNSVLVYYGILPMLREFFDEYFDADSFRSPTAFRKAVEKYQAVAIRLFSTFAEAYARLAQSPSLKEELCALEPKGDDRYRTRTEWNCITQIDEQRLPYLGYIAAAQVRQEAADRQQISTFLRELAGEIRREGIAALGKVSDRKRRRMDSLLRQFESNLRHSLFSPLFSPDPDQLEREALALAPAESDVARMEETQALAQKNLANYLAADHLDVYIATSMRTEADFVSVNRFVTKLFLTTSCGLSVCAILILRNRGLTIAWQKVSSRR